MNFQTNKLPDHYTLQDILNMESFLCKQGTFDFHSFSNGLFPAACPTDPHISGYHNAWIRDNVWIAYAHYFTVKYHNTVKSVETLLSYFSKYQNKMYDIINQPALAKDPMKRPHIRFNGEQLKENRETWAHAQNDALGYFLWLFCKLLNDKKIQPDKNAIQVLFLLVLYFKKICYWQDEDSGHWEETRKISASSIGCVTAGLRELEKVMRRENIQLSNDRFSRTLSREQVCALKEKGFNTLRRILPFECIQGNPEKFRKYDGALLFLIFPLHVVGEKTTDTILRNTQTQLLGDYGIRRYRGDSYWAPDYKDKLEPSKRATDFSDDLSARNALLQKKGSEAQWCIFDPLLSVIYGMKYKTTGLKKYRNLQVQYFNRSLSQITSKNSEKPFRCPELYYMCKGKYIPNDHVPLYWTQANLMMAFHMMKTNFGYIMVR